MSNDLHPANMIHPILPQMRADPHEIMRRQRIAENGLYDAESRTGAFAPSPRGDGEDAAEVEAARQRTIEECKAMLRPVNLRDVLVPQVFVVRLSRESPENQPDRMETCALMLDRPYVLIGEIAQMPGHVVVADYASGILHFGYHIDRFELVPPNQW